ncbi:MAG: hypothetical protein AAFY60_20530, partial [Myxococcota bacterium]
GIDSLAQKLVSEAKDLEHRADRDREAIGELKRRARWDGFVGTIPREIDEIHDLEALARLAGAITLA